MLISLLEQIKVQGVKKKDLYSSLNCKIETLPAFIIILQPMLESFLVADGYGHGWLVMINLMPSGAYFRI